jgi:hypothetical protein
MSSQVSFFTTKPLALVYQRKVQHGIMEAAETWKVKLSSGVILDDHEYLGKESTRFLNRPINESTKQNYEIMLRKFWRFAAITGDYDSMLLLLKIPPKHSPAISAQVIEHFVRFKREKEGSVLRNDAGDAVRDVFGNPITSDGRWKAPKNVDIFRAAIHDLHVANDHTVEYAEPCEECRSLPENRRHEGCEHHKGLPALTRCGDPTRNQVFLNEVINQEKKGKDEGYKEKGCMQLLPSDFRLLRARLLSTRNIADLQMWVIIILAGKLALRHDEFHRLKAEHFLPELFEISETDDRVNALGIKVKGKSDKNWVKLKLHADHVYPELCPVRALLIYMHLAGIKGGSLFPSLEELKNPPGDGIFATEICYKTFLEELKSLCKNVLPDREDFKVGAHIFRKAFYVLGVFGEANEYDLKQSARHKSVENSLIYRKAAQTCYQVHCNHPNPANNMSKWKSIFVGDCGGNIALMAAMGGCKNVTFGELGDFFIRQSLKIRLDNSLVRDSHFLLDKALKYVGADAPSEQFRKFKAALHPDQGTALQQIVDAMILERLKALLERGDIARATSGLLPSTMHYASQTQEGSTSTEQPEAQVLQEPLSKRPRVDANDLRGRHNLRTATTATEKIVIMKQLWAEKDNTPLTQGAKTFVSRSLKPVIMCLENHFGGDIDQFVATYNSFSHTTFQSVCCNGDGGICKPSKAS